MVGPYVAASLYVLTVIVGILGNVWVVCSVARSRKPRSLVGNSSPSDRLRAYISVLALVDLTVLMALLVRAIYLALPHFMLDANSCRVMFILENSLKLSSLTVLSCISIERYLTIRKPFCSQVRKRVVRMTPLAALGLLTLVIAAILIQVPSVSVSSDGLNCVRSFRGRAVPRLGAFVAALAFSANLATICVNYGQIVHHVRRKFVKRRARVVAQTRQQRELLVAEPRYMRQMTSAIVRVGVFHAACWLPFCALQFLPDPSLVSDLSASIRMFANFTDYSYVRCVVFVANWLTYASAAGDWVFYAAMNRDLRNLIRFATERRKRSTMSHATSPSHRSLRKQMTSSMRVLQSVSYRSSLAGSIDDTLPPSLLQASPKSSTVSQDNNSPHTTRHKTALLVACQSSEMI